MGRECTIFGFARLIYLLDSCEEAEPLPLWVLATPVLGSTQTRLQLPAGTSIHRLCPIITSYQMCRSAWLSSPPTLDSLKPTSTPACSTVRSPITSAWRCAAAAGAASTRLNPRTVAVHRRQGVSSTASRAGSTDKMGSDQPVRGGAAKGHDRKRLRGAAGKGALSPALHVWCLAAWEAQHRQPSNSHRDPWNVSTQLDPASPP
jgi:hypothetical protein